MAIILTNGFQMSKKNLAFSFLCQEHHCLGCLMNRFQSKDPLKKKWKIFSKSTKSNGLTIVNQQNKNTPIVTSRCMVSKSW